MSKFYHDLSGTGNSRLPLALAAAARSIPIVFVSSENEQVLGCLLVGLMRNVMSPDIWYLAGRQAACELEKRGMSHDTALEKVAHILDIYAVARQTNPLHKMF